MEKVLEGLALERIRVLDEVKIATREKEGKRFISIINSSTKPSEIFLDEEYTELIKGKRLKEERNLDEIRKMVEEMLRGREKISAEGTLPKYLIIKGLGENY